MAAQRLINQAQEKTNNFAVETPSITTNAAAELALISRSAATLVMLCILSIGCRASYDGKKSSQREAGRKVIINVISCFSDLILLKQIVIRIRDNGRNIFTSTLFKDTSMDKLA